MPEVFEHEDEVVVTLEVPATDTETISATVEGDVLVVEVSERKGRHRREIPLPCAVDATRMQIDYQHGRLHVSLPKARR